MVERPLTPDPPAVAFREATPADHPRLARLVREWWDERPPRLERLWFRHFGPTTLVGTTPDGRLVALVIGFLGPADPTRGVIHMVAVAPGVRRRGVGRAIAEALEARLIAAGATAAEAVIWPGNRAGVRFLEALGYAPAAESPRTRLYGLPAIADYDGVGEDRAIFERALPRSRA